MDRRLFLVLMSITLMSLACSQVLDQSPSPTRNHATAVVGTLTQRALDNVVIPEETGIPGETPVHEPGIIIEESTQPENMGAETVKQEEEPEKPLFLYTLQPGSPVYAPNIFRPDLGCNWMGVGGQVLGDSGQPVGMLVVEIGGTLNGEQLDSLTLTGAANQWGSGGYEINISDTPIDSAKALWVRVLSMEGEPLSEPVYFDTFADCEKTAIIINFVYQEQDPAVEQLHFPVIIQEQ